jgi:hypothetical protein
VLYFFCFFVCFFVCFFLLLFALSKCYKSNDLVVD